MKLRKNKKIIIASVVSVAILSVATIAWALKNGENKLNKWEQNNFRPAGINIAVDENRDPEISPTPNSDPSIDNEIPWNKGEIFYTVDKQVAITNVNKDGINNTDAYIRVTFIPYWTVTTTHFDVSGTEVEELTGTEKKELKDIKFSADRLSFEYGELTYILDDDWEKSWMFNPNDGYFYYKKTVAPGETTSPILSQVSMYKSVKDSQYSDSELHIDVISDAIQTEGGAVAKRWATNKISINEDKELVIVE